MFYHSAIVLSGGNDIGLFSLRDKTEYLILDYALEKKFLSLESVEVCKSCQDGQELN